MSDERRTTDRSEPDGIAAAWAAAQGRLPEGWTLDGLRCASTGLAEDQRSDDWVAVATGPGGAERHARAGHPVEALAALADDLAAGRPRDLPGTISRPRRPR